MRAIVLLSIFALVSGYSVAHSAECNGKEGLKGEWQTTWTKDGESKPGIVEEWRVQQTLGNTATLEASLQFGRGDEFVSGYKYNVPDGNSCHYFGKLTGNSVKGTYSCNKGNTAKFSMTCDFAVVKKD